MNKQKMIEYFRKNILPQYEQLVENDKLSNDKPVIFDNNKDLLKYWARKQEINDKNRRELLRELNITSNIIVKEKIRNDLYKLNKKAKTINKKLEQILNKIKKENINEGKIDK